MSIFSVRGEQSTSAEITALTNLAALAASGTGESIRKTGATTFENATSTGSVSSVSVVTANGVSGSVATATTTPAITLTLGEITPTTVNGLTISTTTGTLTITNGKTLSLSNSLTFTGSDSVSVNFGGGGTVAYTGSLTAANVTVANEATDTTCFPLFVTAATGDLGPKSNTGLTFNSNTATLTATAFSGPLTGNVT